MFFAVGALERLVRIAYRKLLNWMIIKMRKSILSSFFVLVLSGCVATLSGTFRTGKYTDPPPQPFVVTQSDLFDLTERNIVTLIERKMVQHGYVRANSLEAATIAIYYKYSIGPGQMDVSNYPDFVFGGQKVGSETCCPLYFQIIVADVERSKKANKIEMIWQGEVYISSSSAESSTLASYLIDVLFDHFDTTTTNQTKTITQAVPW
jgi:hypothetical protein